MQWKVLAPWLLVSAAVGCGQPAPNNQGRYDGLPTGPVDGPFIVSVIEIEDRCSAKPAAAGGMSEVDVRLRFDGNVDLVSWKAPFPGRQVLLDGLSVESDGQVEHWSSYRGTDGEEYQYRVRGYLFPSLLDLTVEHVDERDCRFRVRLQGVPRPLASTLEVDGIYRLQMAALDAGCPGQPLANAGSAWTAVADIRQFGDRLEVVLDRTLVFEMGLPGNGNKVDHDGSASIVTGSPSSYAWVAWKGILHPNDASGRMTVGIIDAVSGTCAADFAVSGHKLLPSDSDIEGSYRAQYRVTTACPRPGQEPGRSYFDQVIALIQPDGRLRAFDANGVSDLVPLPDGSWQYLQLTPFGALHRTFRTRLPEMDYLTTALEYDVAGQAVCGSDVQATGHKRFLPLE